MSRTRILHKPKDGPKRGAMSPVGWDALMRKVIARAEETEDRRLEGLKKACEEGRSEAFLRRMGIICEVDIVREFPDREM